MCLRFLHSCHLVTVMFVLNTAGSGYAHTMRHRKYELNITIANEWKKGLIFLSCAGNALYAACFKWHVFCFTCVQYRCILNSLPPSSVPGPTLAEFILESMVVC